MRNDFGRNSNSNHKRTDSFPIFAQKVFFTWDTEAMVDRFDGINAAFKIVRIYAKVDYQFVAIKYWNELKISHTLYDQPFSSFKLAFRFVQYFLTGSLLYSFLLSSVISVQLFSFAQFSLLLLKRFSIGILRFNLRAYVYGIQRMNDWMIRKSVEINLSTELNWNERCTMTIQISYYL